MANQEELAGVLNDLIKINNDRVEGYQKAYEAALESDSYMTTEIRQMIANQKSELKTSHDLIRNHRDMQEKVS